MLKIEIVSKSFAAQLAETLQTNPVVNLDFQSLPKSYQENPANLCHKLGKRIGKRILYSKTANNIQFYVAN